MNDTAEPSITSPGSSAEEASSATATQADEAASESTARTEPAAGSNGHTEGIGSPQISVPSAKDLESPATETVTGHPLNLGGEQEKRSKYRALRDLCRTDSTPTDAKSSRMDELKSLLDVNDVEVKVIKNVNACIETTSTNCMIQSLKRKFEEYSGGLEAQTKKHEDLETLVDSLRKKSTDFEGFMKNAKSPRGVKKLDGKVIDLEKDVARAKDDVDQKHQEVKNQLQQQEQRLDEYVRRQQEMLDSLQRCEVSIKEIADQRQVENDLAETLKIRMREFLGAFFARTKGSTEANAEKKFEARIAKLEEDNKETSEVLEDALTNMLGDIKKRLVRLEV